MPGSEIIDKKERKALNKLFLDGGILSSTGLSPKRKNFHVREFEKKICRKFNSKYALAVTSGTAAIKIPTDEIAEISAFGNTIFNLSIKYPIVYGVSSIFFALVAGVAVSFIRRKISRWKYERTNKPAMY